MDSSDSFPSEPKSEFVRITTQWSLLHDPAQLVLRYGLAIRKYLDALLRNSSDAEEVAQEIVLKVLDHGMDNASPEKGRFRFYLKTAVRNAALTYLKKKKPLPSADLDIELVEAPDEPASTAEGEWEGEWRRCFLDRAWRALEVHERQFPDCHYHTVLRLTADHPEEESDALAARASASLGRPLRADAFRKQLSRARRFFAEVLVHEVAETLDEPSPERVEEELIDIGLLSYVRDFLPPDWRARGVLTEPE